MKKTKEQTEKDLVSLNLDDHVDYIIAMSALQGVYLTREQAEDLVESLLEQAKEAR